MSDPTFSSAATPAALMAFGPPSLDLRAVANDLQADPRVAAATPQTGVDGSISLVAVDLQPGVTAGQVDQLRQQFTTRFPGLQFENDAALSPFGR
jgi:hypothetical protein